MSDKTGGPVFPFLEFYGSGEPRRQVPGMTLRDYFAAKAMAVVWKDIPDDAIRADALLYLGKGCYEMADAMLEARNE